jgi:formylglycine-generating enzyme required for sulfatase activity
VEKLRVERLDRERVLREQQAQIEADQREAERLASKRLALEREEAERQTEARRIAALAAENMAKVNAPKAEMVAVEAGPFRSGKGGAIPASTQAFMIDRTEVTTLAYGRCVADGACPEIRPHPRCNLGQEGRDDHPVNCVSFLQATAYCGWVGKRVPTAIEWEKAARGTGGQAFPWGDEAPNCSHQVARIEGCKKPTGTEPVGSRPDGASPNGAVDMMGNVWEWTGDPEGKHSIFRGGALNKGPVSHIHGGAWNTGPVPVHSLNPYSAKNATPSTGFLCVR